MAGEKFDDINEVLRKIRDINLSKLSPAPWEIDKAFGPFALVHRRPDGTVTYVGNTKTDAEFIALARNAFDVMMRRGWNPIKGSSGQWYVEDERLEAFIHRLQTHGGDGRLIRATDPFTALIEADRWYRENVEGPK